MSTTTLISELRRLVDEGVVRCKVDREGLQTFKYHNKVFYNNLWDQYGPALKEARGIVYDQNDQIVQRPFKKIFNHGENATGLEYNDGMLVTAVRKVNGFMAAASYHRSRCVVSTTGTTDSDYAKLALERVMADYGLVDLMKQMGSFTFILEVCDDTDPHIVHENEGVYLLGIRHKETGVLMTVDMVQSLARDKGIQFPEVIKTNNWKVLNELTPNVDHEGFVVYDHFGQQQLYKTKSPHYLSKKAMMRMGRKGAGQMFDNPNEFRRRLDEEFYELHDHLLKVSTKEDWLNADEQSRRWYIEDYFSRS